MRHRHSPAAASATSATFAISSFRFTGDQPDPDPDELVWGEALLGRVLVPENFRAVALPAVRLRAPQGEAPLSFGPKKPSD